MPLILQCVGSTEQAVKAFRTAMEPMRQTLQQHKYLGGDKMSYADIAVAGNFMVRQHALTLKQPLFCCIQCLFNLPTLFAAELEL